MRIVSRPDFDGIVCAALLGKAENIDLPIYWTEPNEIQSGRADIRTGDILANLPYSDKCALWFDHHISNKPRAIVPGAFDIAPSAAGVIYKYYINSGRLKPDYDDLVLNTDIIDSADLNQDQVRHPENYPYILLSMTIKNENYKDIDYWNHLVSLLLDHPIKTIMKDSQVKTRSQCVVEENKTYGAILKKYTRINRKISITDFRSLDNVPNGNRFLSYSIFPDSIASLKIRYSGKARQKVQISVGASIFNCRLNVNIGRLLSQFGGGGHKGAGGCTLEGENADQQINEILEILYTNKPID